MHAGWNLLMAGADDSEAAGAVALVAGVVLFTPAAVATWDIDAAAWPYIAASAALEIAYWILLGRAYRRSELTVVYPIARGSGPVFVLIGSVVLGATLSAAQVAGVAAVAAGVLAIRGVRADTHRRDLVLALGIGAMIAGYTLVDKDGLKHADALPYLWVVLAIVTAVYLPLLIWARGSRLSATIAWARAGRQRRAGARARVRSGLGVLRAEVSLRTVAAGAGVFGAYVLTLAALARAPAAPVAAIRETSVLFATAFGAAVLHERVTPARVVGAVAIVVGVAAIALG